MRRAAEWMDGRTNKRTVILYLWHDHHPFNFTKYIHNCYAETLKRIPNDRNHQVDAAHKLERDGERESVAVYLCRGRKCSHARQRFSTWLTRNLCCVCARVFSSFPFLRWCVRCVRIVMKVAAPAAAASNERGEMFIFVILIYRAFLYFLVSSCESNVFFAESNIASRHSQRALAAQIFSPFGCLRLVWGGWWNEWSIRDARSALTLNSRIAIARDNNNNVS